MTRRAFLTMTTWAAGTAALVLAAGLPPVLEAEGENLHIPARVAQPKATVDGCEVSARLVRDADAPPLKAGDMPVFRLIANNPTEREVTIECALNLTGTPITSPFSRMLPVPRSLWQHREAITLKAYQTKTIMLKPEVKLPDQQEFSLNIGPTIAGLAVAAGLISVAWRAVIVSPPRSILPDCEGAMRVLVIQYAASADYAADIYRQFLPALPAETTVYAVCPDQAAFDEMMGRIGLPACRVVPVFSAGPVTAWSRDRWVALRDEAGTTTLACPRGEAGADLWPARAGDQRVGELLSRTIPGVGWQRQAIYFDGGDFVADDRAVFIAPNVIRRNVQQTVADLAELRQRLAALAGRPIILLDDAPEHHAGMFMMAAGDGTVLVGDPSLGRSHAWPDLPGGPDFSTETQAKFDSVARQAADAGYRVIRMPTVPAMDGRTWLTYLNVLIDVRAGHRIVYMPVYDGAGGMNDAAERIWQGLGHEVRRIDCTQVFRHFGCLRCLVNVADRG